MHHKRKRPKHQRGGCLFCKPFKDNGIGGSERQRFNIWRRMEGARHDLAQALDERTRS